MEEDTKKYRKSIKLISAPYYQKILPFTIDNAPRFKIATLFSQHSLQLSGEDTA